MRQISIGSRSPERCWQAQLGQDLHTHSHIWIKIWVAQHVHAAKHLCNSWYGQVESVWGPVPACLVYRRIIPFLHFWVFFFCKGGLKLKLYSSHGAKKHNNCLLLMTQRQHQRAQAVIRMTVKYDQLIKQPEKVRQTSTASEGKSRAMPKFWQLPVVSFLNCSTNYTTPHSMRGNSF